MSCFGRTQRLVYTPTTTDPLADRLGQAASARVTVIAQDGTVLGDSALTIEQVQQLDNHGSRPEVVAALANGRGVARRFSATLRTDMLYVAVPLARADGLAVVRTATPLDEIEPVVNQLRVLLGVAGLLGLAIAVFMSGLASHFLSRTLRSLVQHASAMAAGARQQRIAVATTDEIGGLAGSLNRMAEDLEQAVTTLATERDRFAAVLEGLADAILALDAEQRIILVNRAALTLLDLTEPPLGRTLLEIIRVPAPARPGRAGPGRYAVNNRIRPTDSDHAARAGQLHPPAADRRQRHRAARRDRATPPRNDPPRFRDQRLARASHTGERHPRQC